jgi:Flp pilus assembly protein TadD
MKGDDDKGLADYDQAIKFDPDDALSYNNRGIARVAKGDRAGAIADFRKALTLAPHLQQPKDQLRKLGATP